MLLPIVPAYAMHEEPMSMEQMIAMLKTKTGDDFDRTFIEMMIPHHQGAIAMARIAKHEAQNEELQNMAEEMIDEQRGEIRTLKRWFNQWDYDHEMRMSWRDMSMTMQGHSQPMTMDEMVDMLRDAEGMEFDMMFIDMMIPHHQGAIDMAKVALTNAKHQEIKDMAQMIITSQQEEIEHLKHLRSQLPSQGHSMGGNSDISWNEAKNLLASCRVRMTTETHAGVLTFTLDDGSTRRVTSYNQQELYARIQDANAKCPTQIVIGME